MPLGQGIVEVFRAIPPRIEVTGHGPTVRVTAGSFDAALGYARECYGDPAVLGGELRYRFWPRVTLTVTTDPDLAGSAPPLEELRDRLQQQEAGLRASRGAHRAGPGTHRAEPGAAPSGPLPGPGSSPEQGLSTLEEIFAHQELQRQERARIPTQRGDGGGTA
jgi:hypothetical protein